MHVLLQRYLFATIGAGFKVYDALAHKLVAECHLAHYSKILHLAFVYNGLVSFAFRITQRFSMLTYYNAVERSTSDDQLAVQ